MFSYKKRLSNVLNEVKVSLKSVPSSKAPPHSIWNITFKTVHDCVVPRGNNKLLLLVESARITEADCQEEMQPGLAVINALPILKNPSTFNMDVVEKALNEGSVISSSRGEEGVIINNDREESQRNFVKTEFKRKRFDIADFIPDVYQKPVSSRKRKEPKSKADKIEEEVNLSLTCLKKNKRVKKSNENQRKRKLSTPSNGSKREKKQEHNILQPLSIESNTLNISNHSAVNPDNQDNLVHKAATGYNSSYKENEVSLCPVTLNNYTIANNLFDTYLDEDAPLDLSIRNSFDFDIYNDIIEPCNNHQLQQNLMQSCEIDDFDDNIFDDLFSEGPNLIDYVLHDSDPGCGYIQNIDDLSVINPINIVRSIEDSSNNINPPKENIKANLTYPIIPRK